MVVVHHEELLARTDNVGDGFAVEITLAFLSRQLGELRRARGHFGHSERELGRPEVGDRDLHSRHFLLLVPTGPHRSI